MGVLTFGKVTTLYQISGDTRITRHRIAHPVLGDFSASLDRLDKALGEQANDDYWRKFTIPLKRIRFGLCAAPFSREYRQQRVYEALTEAKQNIRFVEKIYPHPSSNALAVIQCLEMLLKSPEDPLLTALFEITSRSASVAWVVKESRLIPDVEDVISFSSLNKTHVVHPTQLKDITCYDQIIVIGPARWFPDNVFTAPRSTDLHVLIFDWIRDDWKPKDTFKNPYRSATLPKRPATVEDHGTFKEHELVDADSLLVVVDKVAAVNSILESTTAEEYESVQARCVFLEGDSVVFIDAGENATTLTIDLEEEPNRRIVRVPVKNIQAGTFILVRTGGGGDYIVPLADQILGSHAEKARKYQAHWKHLLREYVRNKGLFPTSITLLDLGSTIANEINVSNWMSPRSIRTQNYDDFLAIMRLIGLEAGATEYWKEMDLIDRAHRRAGHQIRDLLLAQVENIDVDMLHKRGRMEFRLSEQDDSGITAFRVESILDQIISVPYTRIGQPYRLDSVLWQE